MNETISKTQIGLKTMTSKIAVILILILTATSCRTTEKIKTTENASKTIKPYGAKDFCKRNPKDKLCGQKK